MPHGLKQCLQGLLEMPLKAWDIEGKYRVNLKIKYFCERFEGKYHLISKLKN